VTFPPRDPDTDPDAPTIDERRQVLADAGAATVSYIEATWQWRFATSKASDALFSA
jgi:hypothetical protein